MLEILDDNIHANMTTAAPKRSVIPSEFMDTTWYEINRPMSLFSCPAAVSNDMVAMIVFKMHPLRLGRIR